VRSREKEEVKEEGLTYEQIKAAEEREAHLRSEADKFGQATLASLLGIPKEIERDRRHLANVYDPSFDRG
jgi:hypothetical protein